MLPATAVHERLARLTRTVIEEAAARGNAVIVGRGGAFILGRRAGRRSTSSCTRRSTRASGS